MLCFQSLWTFLNGDAKHETFPPGSPLALIACILRFTVCSVRSQIEGSQGISKALTVSVLPNRVAGQKSQNTPTVKWVSAQKCLHFSHQIPIVRFHSPHGFSAPSMSSTAASWAQALSCPGEENLQGPNQHILWHTFS